MQEQPNAAPAAEQEQKVNGAERAGPGADVAAQLVITLMKDGRLNVQGPIHDLTACYGMLEVAKDVLRDHVRQLNQPRIQAPGRKNFLDMLRPGSHVSAKRR